MNLEAFIVSTLIWFSQAIPGYENATTLPPPPVFFVDAATLCAKVSDVGGEDHCTAHGLSGGYREDEGVMYLPLSFDPASGNDQSALVHELFHFVQGKNGTFDAWRRGEVCKGKIEAEAYQVQHRWRLENRVAPFFVQPPEALTRMRFCQYAF